MAHETGNFLNRRATINRVQEPFPPPPPVETTVILELTVEEAVILKEAAYYYWSQQGKTSWWHNPVIERLSDVQVAGIAQNMYDELFDTVHIDVDGDDDA